MLVSMKLLGLFYASVSPLGRSPRLLRIHAFTRKFIFHQRKMSSDLSFHFRFCMRVGKEIMELKDNASQVLHR
jgi:hypothetical protein